jgi:hypothetical protein
MRKKTSREQMQHVNQVYINEVSIKLRPRSYLCTCHSLAIICPEQLLINDVRSKQAACKRSMLIM